ncbi:MAG: glycosyltransferase [Armatimonadota bacterium]|nr:glycosyltransferase [Armatimonadota bacterium]MDR7453909.1 glycosyltransferase [Armatimonadota bacterium]MDR7456671.1 glycosyltransferase [Armatimonadota bacterium]MDR7495734.1 glycosyltransferase [Armatimonadota bacterium]MDR7511545.1 glycosyltransferase [Armatimonadota bacterium]
MNARVGPLVSVIIPSHNYAHFLGAAIQSALDQRYRPLEVIVVDDGSTDDTPAVLERYAGRVKALRLDGRGVAAARNAGLARAEGRYVIFLDADDLLLPDGVTAQVARCARDPDLGVVIGAWYVCDVRLGTSALVHSPLRAGSVLPQLLRGNVVTTPSALLARRDVLAAAGGFDTDLSFTADWEMWIRLARGGVRFATIETPTAVYRVHGHSMTRDLERAVRDVVLVQDRCFADPLLDGETRAVEPAARGSMLQYLGRLATQQGDADRAAALLRRALACDPSLADSLDFYHGIARALWDRERRAGRGRVAAATTRLPAVLARIDPTPTAHRRALLLLAAGIVARGAGAWGQAVRSLLAALRASPSTVLAAPQRTAALRLPVPPWLTGAVRGLLARAGLRPATDPPLPPLVAALLGDHHGHRRA